MLDKGTPPEEAQFVFDLYWSKFRAVGLTFQEIYAYQEVTGIRLASWEVELLFVIHNAAEKYINELMKAP